MSDSNVVGLTKLVFPQSDPGSPLKGQNALLTGASYGIGCTNRDAPRSAGHQHRAHRQVTRQTRGARERAA
jgi:hypothetical protein